MQRPWKKYAYACVALLALGVGAAKAQASLDASEKEIERYRAMINDPMANPGYLAVDRGEAVSYTHLSGPIPDDEAITDAAALACMSCLRLIMLKSSIFYDVFASSPRCGY